MGTSQQGYTVTEIMIAMAIVAITSLAAGTIVTSVTQFEMNNRLKTTALDVRAQASEIVSQKRLWNNTVLQAGSAHPTVSGATLNPSLTCVRDGTACVDVLSPLSLQDRSGNFITDPDQPTLGFTRDGARCNTFSMEDNTTTCVMRLDASWKPSCPPAGPCIAPLVLIELKVISSQGLSGESLLSGKNVVAHITAEDYNPTLDPPAPQTFFTNAIGETGTNDVLVDLTSIVANIGTTTYTLLASSSTQGAALSMTGNTVTYTPPANFHGSDTFSFTVSRFGKTVQGDIRINVMTPYTWVGDGASEKPAWAPVANSPYPFVTDIKNWCGVVQSNSCSHTGLNITGGGTIDFNQNELIFNDTCYGANCSAVWLNMGNSGISASPASLVRAGAIEIQSTWAGKVFAGSNLELNRGAGGRLRVSGGTFDALAGSDGVVDTSRQINVGQSIELSGAATFLAPGGALKTQNFIQTGGSFQGGSANLIQISPWTDITASATPGNFTISGGTFKSTSNRLFLQNSHMTVSSAATSFVHNRGEFYFESVCCSTTSGTHKLSIDGITFYKMGLQGNAGGDLDFLGSKVTIENVFTLFSNTWNCQVTNANNANFYAKGDIEVKQDGWSGTNSTLYLIGGTQLIHHAERFSASNNWTGYPCNAGSLPLTMFQSTGAVTLDGDFRLGYGFKHLSGGFITTGSTVNVGQWDGVIPVYTNGQTFNNLTFQGNTNSFDMGGQTANVTGTLTFSGMNWSTGIPDSTFGIINAFGNIMTEGNGVGGAMQVFVKGGSTQVIGGTDIGRQYAIPYLCIESPGTVSFKDRIGFSTHLGWSSGNTSFGGSTIMRVDDRYTATLDTGPMLFDNFNFRSWGASSLNGNILKVTGDLTIDNKSSLYNGSIELSGNISGSGGFIDDSTGSIVKFVGNNTQTVDLPPPWGYTAFKEWILNKSGGSVKLLSNIDAYSARGIQKLTINPGNTFDMDGKNLWISAFSAFDVGPVSNSGTLRLGSAGACGTLTANVTGNAPICP